MSNQTPVSKPTYSLLPTDVEGFDSLAEVDTRQAAIRAVAGAGFAMDVTAVIRRLLGLVAVG
jgi:hypothetical protein